MDASPLPFEELAARLNQPHPTTLRAGSAIIAWLREQETPRPGIGAAALLGLAVHEDLTLDNGEWVTLDQHGTECGRGRVGQPGEVIAYVPGTGFIAFELADLDRGRFL